MSKIVGSRGIWLRPAFGWIKTIALQHKTRFRGEGRMRGHDNRADGRRGLKTRGLTDQIKATPNHHNASFSAACSHVRRQGFC
jgi:hypothetical protein